MLPAATCCRTYRTYTYLVTRSMPYSYHPYHFTLQRHTVLRIRRFGWVTTDLRFNMVVISSQLVLPQITYRATATSCRMRRAHMTQHNKRRSLPADAAPPAHANSVCPAPRCLLTPLHLLLLFAIARDIQYHIAASRLYAASSTFLLTVFYIFSTRMMYAHRLCLVLRAHFWRGAHDLLLTSCLFANFIATYRASVGAQTPRLPHYRAPRAPLPASWGGWMGPLSPASRTHRCMFPLVANSTCNACLFTHIHHSSYFLTAALRASHARCMPRVISHCTRTLPSAPAYLRTSHSHLAALYLIPPLFTASLFIHNALHTAPVCYHTRACLMTIFFTAIHTALTCNLFSQPIIF